VDSFKKSKEQLDRIKHIDTSIVFDGYIKSMLARAYYENGNYKEAADIFAGNAIETEDPNFFKNIDETTNKLRAFQEKELNGRIKLLTELQDAQDKKLQYQKTILSLLALIIAILLFAFIIITKENKKANSLKDKLYIQSITDSLTGIFNRRRILEALNKEAGNNSIIALADIDDFKKINDNLGHLVGDEVLKKVADTIKNSIRDKDEVGRYGGEEFIIIIRETDLSNAVKVIERIRKSVESIEWEYEDLKTSISVGAAEKKSLSAEEVFKEVDNLMHEAKKKGKNRVVYR
jgi:diguanylate cyclase (GGDEF)-like protein